MPSNIIAFDIGTAQLKLAWFSGKTCRLTASAPVPDGLVRGGVIVSMDAMADFLWQLAKEHNLPRKAQAAVILPASLTFTRVTELPPMTAAQLTYNLPFEFKDYLTHEKNKYYFDYAVQELTRDETGTVRQMKLFACAALKSTVEDYRNMFARAGMKLAAALPEEAAYAALLSAGSAQPDGDTDHCFVDVGHTGIRMYILRAGRFLTRRTIDLGVADLIHSISQRQGVDEHIALAHLLSDYDGAVSDPASLEVYHRMAAEITKAVNFYNYNNREKTLSRVYLCGGGAAITQIHDAIRQLTDLEICPVTRLLPDGISPDEAYLYPRAVGCALQD